MNRGQLHQLALAAALATGLFLVMLGGLLAYNELRGKVTTLVNSKEVVRLHDELRHRPKDEALKTRIRQLDLQLRQNTFYRLQLSHNASRAMIYGLVAFLASAHFVRTSRQRPPDPLAWGARRPDEKRTTGQFGRYAVAVVFAFVAFGAVLVSLRPVQLPERVAPAAPETFPTTEEIQQNWAGFRGPNGLGVARDATVPVPWHVRWKTPVPLPGMSSPVLWSSSVFVTGANANENRVFRFDAETGSLLWSATVRLQALIPKVGDDTGFAAPTPVTDGRRVYAMFANGVVAAFDLAGKEVWARNVGPVENAYGYASSLALYRDRLLIQIDRGMADEGQSRLVALDTRTGQERWQVKRDVAGSWASPVDFEFNQQPQLITCATPFVIAYNPVDGTELWRAKGLETDCAPSPVLASNTLVVVAPNTALIALRAGTTNVLWKAEDGVPDATSPVSDGQRLYTVDSEGLLTCYGLQTGKVLWTHQFDDRFYASPTIAGKALVLLSRKGVAYLLEPGDKYRELGRGGVGEDCGASPVPHGKRLYIRGKQNLFCIE